MKEKLYCKICGKELQGSQRMYCSNKCKQKGHYQEIKNNPNTHETICAWGCDDVMPQDESYNGHLVDALFEMVLYINQNHKEKFTEYKEKLHHFIKSW